MTNFFKNFKKSEDFIELIDAVKSFSICLLFYLILFSLICLMEWKIDEELVIAFTVMLSLLIITFPFVALETMLEYYFKNRPSKLSDDLPPSTDFSNQIKAWSFEHPPWM